MIAYKYPDWKVVFAGNGEIEVGKSLAKKMQLFALNQKMPTHTTPKQLAPKISTHNHQSKKPPKTSLKLALISKMN